MTTLKVSSPAELISAVPFLIGFHPADSLIVVAMRGPRVTFAVRIDLPEHGTPEEQARAAVLHLATVVLEQQAEAVTIIGYGEASRVTPAVLRVSQAFRKEGLTIVDELRVAGGRFWSYLCSDLSCCPAEGQPCEPSNSVVAAEATFAGAVALPSREALAAQLAPVTGDDRDAMEVATIRAILRLAALASERPPPPDATKDEAPGKEGSPGEGAALGEERSPGEGAGPGEERSPDAGTAFGGEGSPGGRAALGEEKSRGDGETSSGRVSSDGETPDDSETLSDADVGREPRSSHGSVGESPAAGGDQASHGAKPDTPHSLGQLADQAQSDPRRFHDLKATAKAGSGSSESPELRLGGVLWAKLGIAAPVPEESKPAGESAELVSDEDYFFALVRSAGRLAVREAERCYSAGGRLTDDDAAWLGVLLMNMPVRDYAWTRTRTREWELAFWSDLMRRVESRYLPAPAALLAFVAWRMGLGPLASVALERALEQKPDYSLATLLHNAIIAGVPPSVLDGWPVVEGMSPIFDFSDDSEEEPTSEAVACSDQAPAVKPRYPAKNQKTAQSAPQPDNQASTQPANRAATVPGGQAAANPASRVATKPGSQAATKPEGHAKTKPGKRQRTTRRATQRRI